MGTSWTDRMEAVKSYVFDLEGNVAARNIESKRAPGCYTLQDAIKLTHSSVCGFVLVVLYICSFKLQMAFYYIFNV